MKDTGLTGLNPEQREAALHTKGPLLILAGAGSGKTTVLVTRAGRLLQEDPNARLCVLTFTNKAARELKSRVSQRWGGPSPQIWAGTFHSFGLQLLRQHAKAAGLMSRFGIVDAQDSASIIRELLRDLNVAGKTKFDIDRIQSQLSRWREVGCRKATKDDEYEVALEWLLPKYEKRLRQLGVVDFDGLLLEPRRLLLDPEIGPRIRQSYDYVMVDEFQDTNHLQMDLLRELVKDHNNVAVVGDDDQSIYGWRGAQIENILQFPKHYPGCKVVRLERNYRSTRAILDLANAVIRANQSRHPKTLRPASDEVGRLPEVFSFENEQEECESVAAEIKRIQSEGHPYKDIAILYRSNGQGALLESELRKNDLPYRISGATAFFDRKETRDALAYLKCLIQPNDVAFRRILNVPSRGIGERSVERLHEHSQTTGKSFIFACRQWQQAGVEPKTGRLLEQFQQQLHAIRTRLLASPTPSDQFLKELRDLGYGRYLEKHSKDSMAAGRRWRFVEILSDVLGRFVERGGNSLKTYKEFIDAMELRDSDTKEGEEEKDELQLLTLHACKGLEFPFVILMGVEEGLLPHQSLGSDVSEERRLFYVGVTRAEKHLILTRSRRRRRHGKEIDVPASRFLLELPKGLVEQKEGPRQLTAKRRTEIVADLYEKLGIPVRS